MLPQASATTAMSIIPAVCDVQGITLCAMPLTSASRCMTWLRWSAPATVPLAAVWRRSGPCASLRRQGLPCSGQRQGGTPLCVWFSLSAWAFCPGRYICAGGSPGL